MVMVAVPVHERGAVVRHCLAAAAELALPEGSEIVVIDDASPSLDVRQLIAETGLRCRFERREERAGAEGMVREVWARFLASPHRHLFFLDSDMVANTGAVLDGLRLSEGFDGLISLYNSALHAGGAREGELLRKRTVGNAGTFWSRTLVERVTEWVAPGTPSIDFAYCAALESHGVPIAATVRSRVQHIGFGGTNNQSFGFMDHGLGFEPDGLAQWRAIAWGYDELMRRQHDFVLPPWSAFKSGLRRLLRG